MYKLRTMLYGKQHNLELVVEKSDTGMTVTLTFFRLFVILLGISHLSCLKAVPITRTESLMHGRQVHLALTNIRKVLTERNWHLEEPTITERMDLAVHDYASSGANGRHTPKAPYE